MAQRRDPRPKQAWRRYDRPLRCILSCDMSRDIARYLVAFGALALNDGRVLRPGDCTGMGSLTGADEPWPADAVAKERTGCWVLSREAFQQHANLGQPADLNQPAAGAADDGQSSLRSPTKQQQQWRKLSLTVVTDLEPKLYVGRRPRSPLAVHPPQEALPLRTATRPTEASPATVRVCGTLGNNTQLNEASP